MSTYMLVNPPITQL